MRSTAMPVTIVGLVALGLMVPIVALADGHTSEGVPRLIITVVCTIYSEHMDEALTGIESTTGINLGLYASDCEIDTEYIVEAPLPSVAVAIPEGALFPSCETARDCFDPYTVIVEAGTGVTWTNYDNVLHTVTGDQPHPDGMFDRWLLPGEEYTFTFETPGTYEYNCVVHPWASGVVVVEPKTVVVSEPTAPETTTEPSNPELAIDLVDALIAQYKENGVEIFEIITELDPDKEVVRFVIESANFTIVAHDSNPAFLGFPVKPLLDQASIPIDTLLQIVEEEDEGVWLSYPLPDVAGNIVGYERGWFKMYDGYVFGARYGVDIEERVQGTVDEMIRLYDQDPKGAFGTINSFMSPSPNYPFVLDPDTTTVVAHGSNPDRVDTVSVVLSNSTVPLEIFRNMEHGEGVWAEYMFLNPETGMESLKRSWLVLYDGYLFGAGYYP